MTLLPRRTGVVRGGLVLVVVAALAIAVRRLDAQRVAHALAGVQLWWVVLATIAYVTVLPLWALQWRIIAPQTEANRFRSMLGTVAASAMMHNTAVAFVGEGSAVLMLVRRIGLGRGAAVSVLAMDQLLVGIAKLTLLILCALLVPLPAWMDRGLMILSIGLVVAVISALTFLALHRAGVRLVALPSSVARGMDQAGLALDRLRTPSVGASALALALAKKGMEFVALFCIQRAFGVHMPFAGTIFALAALDLATMIPLVPANIGVFEGAVVLAYTRFGIPVDQALGLALVQHASYLAAFVLPGAGYLLASARRAVTA